MIYEDQRVIDLFRKSYEENGYHPNSLIAASWERLAVTYRQVADNLDFSGKTMLDAGCGFCNLLDYLVNERYQFPKEYTGIDIVPGFVEDSTKTLARLPKSLKIKTDLLVGNFYEVELPKVDIVVGLGMSNSAKTMTPLIHRMWALAEEALVFECLSSLEYQGVLLAHDPVEVLQLCLRLSRNVRLLYDYGDQEFLVIMKK